jgi:hypothetical protein
LALAAGALLCVREVLPGVAEATCVESVLALADFGLLSMDGAALDVWVLSIDDAGGVVRLLAAAVSLLSFRQSLNADPVRPVQGAYELLGMGAGVAAVLVDALSVVWAPAKPATANAAARSRALGLNGDEFIYNLQPKVGLPFR